MNGQRLIGLGIALAVLATCSLANAGFIPNAIPDVTGTAFHPGDAATGDGSISQALNGLGLTVGDPSDSSTWTHDTSWQNNWQGQGAFVDGETPGAWFLADLGAVQDELARLYMWNVREAPHTDRGIKNVDIYYATNVIFPPTTAWNLLGNYTIPEAPGGATAADMVIDLSGIPSARYIGLEINSNYGSTFRVGFAEMQITTVPEPSSILLVGLALAGLGLVIGKRRLS